MHVFIAGLMQGSRQDHLIDGQDYRERITAALLPISPKRRSATHMRCTRIALIMNQARCRRLSYR